jgi:glycosyltransferase involved in cell wall biosynthesis
MCRKKSILIIGSYPPPFGGVPRHLQELAPLLATKGWDVHILATGHSGVESHPGFTVYKEERAQKVKRVVGGVLKGDWSVASCMMIENGIANRAQLMAWASLGRSIMQKHPVKIISVYNLLRLPVGVLLSEEFDVPLVVSNFGEAHSHRRVLERRIEVVRHGIQRAAKLISISRHCAASYQMLGLDPQVAVIPYGIDTNRFSPTVDASLARRRLGISADELVVLYVGRMVRDMGLETVLAVIPSVHDAAPRARFVLVGGRGDMYPDVERLIAEHPNKIIGVPDAPMADLPLLYAAADIVVAPTTGERACGSLAALEAMASGKPVIAADVGGIPEIVTDGVTGVLIPPNDAPELGRSIVELLNDRDRRVLMGARGRERAVSAFDGHVQNERIERLFSDLAQRSARD